MKARIAILLAMIFVVVSCTATEPPAEPAQTTATASSPDDSTETTEAEETLPPEHDFTPEKQPETDAEEMMKTENTVSSQEIPQDAKPVRPSYVFGKARHLP